MNHFSPRRLAAVSLFVLSVSGHAQSVVVVDPTGGAGTFSTVQEAVDAAAPGDTVLIKSGSYLGAATISKSISVVADTGGQVQMNVFWRITALSAGSTVLVDGLSFYTKLFGPAIDVSDCEGAVWFEDCLIEVQFAATGSGSTPDALNITDCPAVVVHACDLAAGPGSTPAGSLDGIRATRSSIYVYGGTSTGGTGYNLILPGTPTPGGSGLAAIDSFVHTETTQFAGGVGGSGAGLVYCQNGAAGGSGVMVSGSSARVQAVGISTAGGVGGASRAPCLAGPTGAEVTTVQGGTFAVSDRRPFSLDADSPVRVGSPVTWNIRGPSGSLVWLLVSRTPMPRLSALGSPFLIDTTNVRLIHAGTLSPTGTLQLAMPAPSLPQGAQAATLYAQVLAFNGRGLTTGAGDAVTVLDASL